ncbi:nitroreductase family deazaflavin-dependent oxidoreductase [Yinghuangia seranimata]|uniref:nitroreductase family deazaflavin-dependent oxidoreductase n=1 Tax=Yinghuangia seranimata TaxID=408067 RepID=UPI00248D1E1B|nr:nitroreductase family deazaflavin-dependent oxidoreductase [Yinghuangia seranimata]MDI2129651.1 nitroreductase family deazaflavin-dependent oxidoreductase [Yinghuangia seranimata]
MSLDGEYEPNTMNWVAKHVERYEATGGEDGRIYYGKPTVILTTLGAKTGKVRKVALMRVADDEAVRYAVVGSLGGAPQNPVWVNNLLAHPDDVRLQDGPVVRDYTARQVEGDERAEWWKRALEAFPQYGEYQKKTERTIPVFVLGPKEG